MGHKAESSQSARLLITNLFQTTESDYLRIADEPHTGFISGFHYGLRVARFASRLACPASAFLWREHLKL